MVRTENNLVSKGNKVLNKTIKVAKKAKRNKKRKLEKGINDPNIVSSQTFKTKKHFFSKYEIGDKLKEGGNGIVFKGKYTSID